MREPPSRDAATLLAEPIASISGYTLLRHVGGGGMGVVYEGRDRDGGRVAIKVMRVGLGAAGEARFAREASFLATLDHPGICAYRDHGTLADGHAYLVMEWLDGEDLAARLRRGRLAVEEAVALGRRLAGALAVVHARGLVHRDLKPGNIFLVGGAVAEAKLLDFGVARSDGTATLTQAGGLVGTLGYMAPEQARGEPEIDGRADLFALGCVLYQCLSGQAPFSGSEPLAVLARLLIDSPPALRSLRAEVPPALEQLIAALLDKRPEGRPRDVEARMAAIASDPGASAEDLPAASGEVERRYFVVLLARLPEAGAGSVRGGSATQDPPTLERFVALARPFRVDFSPLLGGTLLISADIDGPAIDHATELARRALAVRAAFPTAALVLSAGDGTRREHALAGRVLDAAAARLAGAAAGQIAVDPALAGLLAPRFKVEGDDLVAERETPTTRRVLGRQTSFVGRTRELGVVMASFAAALDELRSQAVVVVAEAGLGKSRLMREALARIAAQDGSALVLAAHGAPLGETASLAMVAQLLRHLVGATGPGEPPLARLTAHMLGCLPVPEAREVAGALAALGAAPADGDARRVIDVGRLAWLRWLEVECARRPVVLALEDLQWWDLPSLEFVVAALEDLQDRPLFVLATTRPTGRADLLRACRATVMLELTALTARAGERLVREVLPDLDPARVESVVRRAQGNVFFLEELIRSAGEGEAAETPATVLATVQARLLRLRELDRRLLRAGSVFGPRFTDAGVAAVAGVSIERVRPTLAALELQEMLSRTADYRPGAPIGYEFRHALAQEAAYATLTDEDRARGHHAAAEWLASGEAPDAGAVAVHYLRGGAPNEARRWFLRAAEGAFEAGDGETALRSAEQVVALEATGTELGVVRLVQADARVWSGDLVKGLEWANDAVSRFQPGSTSHYRARARCLQIAGLRLDGQDLAARLHEAMAAEPGPEGVIGWLQYLCDATYIAIWLGDLARSDALLQRIEARLDGSVPPPIVAAALRVRGIRDFYVHDLPRAFARLGEASERFAAVGDLRNACRLDTTIGHGKLLLGDFVEAEARLIASGRVAHKLGATLPLAYQRCCLGALYLQTGRHAEALASLEEALELSEARGDLRGTGASELVLAWYWLERGEPVRAESLARRAHGRLAPLRSFALSALGFLCQALLAQGRVADAMALADEFERSCAVDGMMLEFEHEHLRTLVAARRAAGDEAAAMRSLQWATARLGLILDKQSPEHRRSLCALPPVADVLAQAAAAGLAVPAQ